MCGCVYPARLRLCRPRRSPSIRTTGSSLRPSDIRPVARPILNFAFTAGVFPRRTRNPDRSPDLSRPRPTPGGPDGALLSPPRRVALPDRWPRPTSAPVPGPRRNVRASPVRTSSYARQVPRVAVNTSAAVSGLPASRPAFPHTRGRQSPCSPSASRETVGAERQRSIARRFFGGRERRQRRQSSPGSTGSRPRRWPRPKASALVGGPPCAAPRRPTARPALVPRVGLQSPYHLLLRDGRVAPSARRPRTGPAVGRTAGSG